MTGIAYIDGRRLRRSLVAASAHVRGHRIELDRMNVFPVPDGVTARTWPSRWTRSRTSWWRPGSAAWPPWRRLPPRARSSEPGATRACFCRTSCSGARHEADPGRGPRGPGGHRRKARGANRARGELLDILSRRIGAEAKKVRFGVVHVGAPEIVTDVASRLRLAFGAATEILSGPVTPVLATHLGMGAWGVAYMVEDPEPPGGS